MAGLPAGRLVEQVFYRLKSLFGYGDVPSRNEQTVKAWFYGKLFLAALCEHILKQASFSPNAQENSSSLLIERSLWAELILILKWVCSIIWEYLGVSKLKDKFHIMHTVTSTKRKRAFALQRLFA
jgi:hypothetical protein